jgi:hypothetical protein
LRDFVGTSKRIAGHALNGESLTIPRGCLVSPAGDAKTGIPGLSRGHRRNCGRNRGWSRGGAWGEGESVFFGVDHRHLIFRAGRTRARTLTAWIFPFHPSPLLTAGGYLWDRMEKAGGSIRLSGRSRVCSIGLGPSVSQAREKTPMAFFFRDSVRTLYRTVSRKINRGHVPRDRNGLDVTPVRGVPHSPPIYSRDPGAFLDALPFAFSTCTASITFPPHSPEKDEGSGPGQTSHSFPQDVASFSSSRR